jgi:replicative DNA helicase
VSAPTDQGPPGRRGNGNGRRGPGEPRQPPIVQGRPPPHNLDAEAAVLSAAMLRPEAIPEIAVAVRPDHFYSDSNGVIFAAICELSAKARKVDLETVASLLRDRGRLAEIGGASYLAEIIDKTPAYAHVLDHARIVRRKARLRRLIKTCQRIQAEGYGDVGDEDEFIDAAEAALHGIVNDATEDSDARTMREVLVAVFGDLAKPERDPGVRTGLVDLDAKLGGTRPGQMTLLAAHSGVGKTALGMQIVMAEALDAPLLAGEGDEPAEVVPAVLVISEEMTAEELAIRTLFSTAEIHGSKAAAPQKLLSDQEWVDLRAHAGTVACENVYFDDRPGLTVLKIRARARRVAAQARRKGQRLRAILVDYIQLLDGTSDATTRPERRERELAAISVGLKNLAKEIGVAVFVLAQLNDDAHQKNRLPRKEDLRECKAIPHDADKVILIWNEAAFARSHEHREPGAIFDPEAADFLIDKNRGGETGRVLVWFVPHLVKFRSMTREERDRILDERRTAREQKTNGKGRS